MGPSGVSRRRASVAAAETVAPAVAAAAVAPSPPARWRRWLGTCVCVSPHHFRVKCHHCNNPPLPTQANAIAWTNCAGSKPWRGHAVSVA